MHGGAAAWSSSSWLLVATLVIGCQQGQLIQQNKQQDAASRTDGQADASGNDLVPADLAGADLPDAAAPADGPGRDALLPDVIRDQLAALDASLLDSNPPDLRLPDSVTVDVSAPDQTVSDAQLADAGPEYCSGNVTCGCQAYSSKRGALVNLWGKVREVTFNPDFKIRLVTLQENLRVQQVTSLPLACGKWQTVTFLEDFTYQVVTYNEDFRVRYVSSLPGVP